MKQQEKYSEKDAQRRFEQALRGARMADPKPMKDVPPKRRAKQQERPKKGS